MNSLTILVAFSPVALMAGTFWVIEAMEERRRRRAVAFWSELYRHFPEDDASGWSETADTAG